MNKTIPLRTVRIEEVSKKTGKIRRGETLYTNRTFEDILKWWYKETDLVYIRIYERSF